MVDKAQLETIEQLILTLVPQDGSTIGNRKLLEQLNIDLKKMQDGIKPLSKNKYSKIKDNLINQGRLKRNAGYGGTVSLIDSHLDLNNIIRTLILDLVPKDGSRIGNKNLISLLKAKLKKSHPQIKLSDGDSEYWDARNQLIDEGLLVKGRGQGGSVYLPTEMTDIGKKTKTKKGKEAKTEFPTEYSLYEPFQKSLENWWAKENRIHDPIVHPTHSQGKKATGGKYTRPEFTMVSYQTYLFTPGKILDVTTFEIKPKKTAKDVAGVFETASHSVVAHRSYLAVHSTNWDEDTQECARIEMLCQNFGIGLIVFEHPGKQETWEERVEPKRKNPDPRDIDEFINVQLDKVKNNILQRK